MLHIFIPGNFIPERKYITEILFSEFLGLNFVLNFHKSENYKIVLENHKSIIFEEHFFSKLSEPENYLNKNNLPEKITFCRNKYIPENNIPVIYGNNYIRTDQDGINCGIDIFASSFFMLTRWEEFVIKEKDKHKRFPEHLSFSVKNNIHERPIVNEYVEMLWNMLISLGINQERKKQIYKPIITHDVDFAFKYENKTSLLKEIAGDIIRRKNPFLIPKSIQNYYRTKKEYIKDIFDTYDYLMTISEKNNLKSRFYFIPGLKPEKEVRYNITDKRIIKIIKNIKTGGHIIGLHGTYKSYNKSESFETELQVLKNIYPDIIEGRQHFLRFSIPQTWQIWENAGLKTDSSLSFYNLAGFRAGTCYEYSVFNILARKKLKLKERPLIAMEQAIKKKSLDISDFFDTFVRLSDICKKHSGNFVFLWHNNNFKTPEWKEYAKKYEDILKIIS